MVISDPSITTADTIEIQIATRDAKTRIIRGYKMIEIY
jgi:hypothetical protein